MSGRDCDALLTPWDSSFFAASLASLGFKISIVSITKICNTDHINEVESIYLLKKSRTLIMIKSIKKHMKDIIRILKFFLLMVPSAPSLQLGLHLEMVPRQGCKLIKQKDKSDEPVYLQMQVYVHCLTITSGGGGGGGGQNFSQGKDSPPTSNKPLQSKCA